MNYSTTAVTPDTACPYCSSPGQWTIHPGVCPKIRAKEYYPNGTLKRVEFHGEAEEGER